MLLYPKLHFLVFCFLNSNFLLKRIDLLLNTLLLLREVFVLLLLGKQLFVQLVLLSSQSLIFSAFFIYQTLKLFDLTLQLYSLVVIVIRLFFHLLLSNVDAFYLTLKFFKLFRCLLFLLSFIMKNFGKILKVDLAILQLLLKFLHLPLLEQKGWF